MNKKMTSFMIFLDENDYEKLNIKVDYEGGTISIESNQENLQPKNLHGAHITHLILICEAMNLTWVMKTKDSTVILVIHF